MPKRILTIVVEVDQPEANWIWDVHMGVKSKAFGITKVISICDGDEVERLEEEIEKINDDYRIPSRPQ